MRCKYCKEEIKPSMVGLLNCRCYRNMVSDIE